MTRTWRIGWKILLPLALLLVLLALVFVLSLSRGESAFKLAVLVGIFLPLLLILIGSLRRRVVLDDRGVQVVRLFDVKSFTWNELTSLEAASVRGRAFITLCAGDEFAILSNSYGDFNGLVRALVERLPEAGVSEEAKRLLDRKDSVMAGAFPLWFGVVALVYILWHMLAGQG